MTFGECKAILIATGHNPKAAKEKRPGETCDAGAAFKSRGHSCCWVHFQADTTGPRAGKVEFSETT